MDGMGYDAVIFVDPPELPAATFLWLTARNRNTSVYEALHDVASETVDVHYRIFRTLAPFQDAYLAYYAFSNGFHGFHVESKRYRLGDLGL